MPGLFFNALIINTFFENWQGQRIIDSSGKIYESAYVLRNSNFLANYIGCKETNKEADEIENFSILTKRLDKNVCTKIHIKRL